MDAVVTVVITRILKEGLYVGVLTPIIRDIHSNFRTPLQTFIIPIYNTCCALQMHPRQ